jgi:hypothetical protein
MTNDHSTFGRRDAQSENRAAVRRPPQPAAGDDERAQRHAQIRQDADRQRRRQQPGERDKPADERRQARDETTKPKYDRYTGERLDGEGRTHGRGGGRGRSRSR